jgi:flagellar biosynthesis/type III secretory pathway protein FliH
VIEYLHNFSICQK